MATLLDLPAELLLQIVSYLRVGSNIPGQYGGICRRLQEFVDSENLRIYSLRSPNYHHFKAIFSLFPHRRRTLKVLTYIIVLPEYNRHWEENEFEARANNKAFLNALVPLFKILNTWGENGSGTHNTESYGFTLVLKAVAKPQFSREVWASERGFGIRSDFRRLTNYPRQTPISLPPGAEKNLSIINCVHSLKVNTPPRGVPIHSSDSELSRNIDLRVLQLLAGRMVGLRQEPPDASGDEPDNSQLEAHLSAQPPVALDFI